MLQKVISIVLFLGISSVGFSQNYVDSERQALMLKMEEGLALMNQGDYNNADFHFQQVLEEIDVVPAELCFYFGKNSYHLQKYKQSIDWLNKYIEIKGTTGQFFDQAQEYLSLSESDFLAEKKNPSKSTTKQHSAKSQQIDCDNTPFILCPVCQGSGVIIEQGSLGNAIYHTCPYSDESGRMPCEDYQKYLRGELSAADSQ